MAILIIGGCGFIGSHIADALVAEGEELVIFDRNASQITRHRIRVQYIRGEFGNRGQLEEVFVKYPISHVIHLVSSTVPANSNRDPEFDIRTNIIDTIALLNLCVRYKVAKVLFMSSGGTVYGRPRYLPIDEAHPTDPICSYGITKLAIEKYLHMYGDLYKLAYVVIRASNPFGPMQSPIAEQGVIGVFAYRILQDRELTIWGDGSVVRDYIHVRDLARLCVAALMSATVGVFNAGSGVGRSLSEVIAALEATLDKPARVRHEAGRELDVPKVVLDASLASKIFGWTPQIHFEEGLKDVATWLLSERDERRIN